MTGNQEHSLQLPHMPSSTSSSYRRSSSPGLYDTESRQREIRIPRAKIKGVTEIRADLKVIFF